MGLPKHLESYVHVAGRTAREGRRGRAVSLITDDDELGRLDDFRRALGIKIDIVDLIRGAWSGGQPPVSQWWSVVGVGLLRIGGFSAFSMRSTTRDGLQPQHWREALCES
eukprot:6432652-Prymnesium_polylepis.1